MEWWSSLKSEGICYKKLDSVASHIFFHCKKFSLVWYECFKYRGVTSVMQGERKSHFNQFSGLVTGSAKQIILWEMIWFVTIWVIWSSRNALIFKGKKVVVADMIEQVKITAWLWIAAKDPKFIYPFACWLSNPRGCLGLTNV